MSWVAAATVAAAVVGGAVQADSASKASYAQRKAAADANATQQDQYSLQRLDQEPYREAGYRALTGAENLLAGYKAPSVEEFQKDPYYQWEQQQGAKAVQGSRAAVGGLYSGQTLRALQDRSQMIARGGFNDYANRAESTFGNQYNRFASLAGIGQTGVSQTGAAGMNYANNVSGNLIGAGNAQGAASLAQGNAWQNALNSGISSYKNSGFNYGSNPNNRGAASNFWNGFSDTYVMQN